MVVTSTAFMSSPVTGICCLASFSSPTEHQFHQINHSVHDGIQLHASTLLDLASYQCMQTSFGDRSFAIAGPHTWNNLPDAIRDSSSETHHQRHPGLVIRDSSSETRHLRLVIRDIRDSSSETRHLRLVIRDIRDSSSETRHPRLVSVILNICKTVKIIFICLTAVALVTFNWRLTNVLTN